MRIFTILIAGVFVNNFLLSKFLGICSFLGVSKKVDTSIGMGIAVIFVMTLASAITYVIQYGILSKLGLEYLQTIAFILVVAALVQLVEMFIKKSSMSLYQALGIYLPLITTNCAVLGVCTLNIQNSYNFIESVVNGAAGGIGYTLAIVLMAAIRERAEVSDVPEAFQGFPITMITASLMAISFLGFSGML
ncbi:electron transport complex subunit RsxA [Pseudoramibacter porci]|uniref:Ion-translocating oxidoreductase complex subunit A n=1 Tax=Pseudoramibacter porci TaxID=2606631 RepID=A0A7X2NGF3_9FIRM|nr:electron transport complex subunit RsxA [Pseudoramibacter porci]MSS19648.1 electron transport complex subunit RsxA [Pseudoramibacter porci]